MPLKSAQGLVQFRPFDHANVVLSAARTILAVSPLLVVSAALMAPQPFMSPFCIALRPSVAQGTVAALKVTSANDPIQPFKVTPSWLTRAGKEYCCLRTWVTFCDWVMFTDWVPFIQIPEKSKQAGSQFI